MTGYELPDDPGRGGTLSIRDMLRNITWLGAANVAVKPIWFVFATALCMRLLGVEGYGVFSAAIALSLMATSITDPGVFRYTSREISRDRSTASLHVSNLFPMRLAALGVSAAIAFATAIILDFSPDGLLAVLFASAYAVAQQANQYCQSVFEAFERLKVEAGLLVVEKILVVGLGSVALVMTREAHWTLAGMALGMAMTATASALWIERNLARFRRSLFDWQFIGRSLKAMIPIGLGGMFISLYYRVDILMIEAMLGEAPTGHYGVAYRILEAMNMITAVVVLAALYPRLSRLAHECSGTEFSQVLARGLMGLTVISVVAAATITAFSPLIISILAGDSGFDPSVTALRILIWAFPLLCANSLLYSALLAVEDERFTAWMVGGAVIFNVGLNFRLIPTLGINGAAIATIAPEIVILLVYTVRYRLLRRQAFS